MAKCGNHGQIIPRDRELLYRLHFVEHKTLSEMAAMFGCTNHHSVGNVLRKMGFPMPGQGYRAPKLLCIDCGKLPPKRLPHKLAKNGTGTRCEDCLLKYKRNWLKKALKTRPEVKMMRKAHMRRWYYEGPINPKGEKSWIRKGRALLRQAKRALRRSRAASLSRNAVFVPAETSPV